MTFQDIFKSRFLENFSEFSLTDVLLAMLFSFLVGVFICLIYRKSFQGVMYSSGFSVTLIGLCMVTTLVILAVTSNVVLSLGMVGALSIVRFRAAIKEPFEIAFLFWSVAAGIVIGAGMFPMAVAGSAVIGLVFLLFARRRIGSKPYILVVSCGSDSEAAVLRLLDGAVKHRQIRAKTVTAAGTELTVEVTLKDEDTSFVTSLSSLDGVSSAALVSYNGQFAG